jgi:aspartyl/asparaginyl beta-hydroxylase (cupin superfamily)
MAESHGLVLTATIKFVNWLQRRIYRAAGGSSRPVFYDVAETQPKLDLLRQNYPVIRAEVEALLKSDPNLPTYHQLDPRQQFISNADPKKWKVFVLYAMGIKPDANRARCPKTAELLDQVPHLIQAFFSILEAGKAVPAHDGPNYGQIRYHLGLIVPKQNPPSIRVKDTVYTWKEGESVMFDDTWNHEVYNPSAEDRVILLVDTMRPLPLHLHLLNVFYSKVIARIAYARKVVAIVDQFR